MKIALTMLPLFALYHHVALLVEVLTGGSAHGSRLAPSSRRPYDLLRSVTALSLLAEALRHLTMLASKMTAITSVFSRWFYGLDSSAVFPIPKYFRLRHARLRLVNLLLQLSVLPPREQPLFHFLYALS